MTTTFRERNGYRLVEVDRQHDAMITVLRREHIEIVSIDGAMLGPEAEPGEIYLCVARDRECSALAALVTMLEQALGDSDLRRALIMAGRPRIAQVGGRSLIWFEALHGEPVAIN